jgi:hypothetical protein
MGKQKKIIKIQNISAEKAANELAQLLYQKPLSECFGEKQSLQNTSFIMRTNIHIRVSIPKHYKVTYAHRDDRFVTFIYAMLRHFEKKGGSSTVIFQ